jgi:hypothetical protein
MQAFNGLVEVGVGGGMTLGSGGFVAPLGWPVMAHGLDQFITGVGTVISGKPRHTVTSQLLQKTGMSPSAATLSNDCISIFGSMAGTAAIHARRLAAFPAFNLPVVRPIASINPHAVRFSQSSISNTFRNGTTIDDLAISLKSGSTRINEIPSIRLVEKNNILYTLDNRRLEAFRRASLQIPYRMATAEEIATEMWKFTTKNEGISVRIKGK